MEINQENCELRCIESELNLYSESRHLANVKPTKPSLILGNLWQAELEQGSLKITQA